MKPINRFKFGSTSGPRKEVYFDNSKMLEIDRKARAREKELAKIDREIYGFPEPIKT